MSSLGYKHTEEARNKIRAGKIGDKNPSKRPDIRKKLSKIRKGKGKGNKNSNWRGGIATKNDRLRHTTEMKLWRKSIFERDNFTCQKTGKRGGKLVAHHINNFAEFPELRTSIENGITLSEIKHKEFHKIYGIKNNTKEQLQEYLEVGHLGDYLY